MFPWPKSTSNSAEQWAVALTGLPADVIKQVKEKIEYAKPEDVTVMCCILGTKPADVQITLEASGGIDATGNPQFKFTIHS